MGETDDGRSDEYSLPFGREDLDLCVGLILDGDPDTLARLLDTFRRAIDGGPRGINAARRGLITAIELSYLRTGSHDAALRLYRLYLEGELKVEDEPLTLIGGAIERSAEGPRRSGFVRQRTGGARERGRVR